eukprot:661761-Hanusia_phi.AAC.3
MQKLSTFFSTCFLVTPLDHPCSDNACEQVSSQNFAHRVGVSTVTRQARSCMSQNDSPYPLAEHISP